MTDVGFALYGGWGVLVVIGLIILNALVAARYWRRYQTERRVRESTESKTLESQEQVAQQSAVFFDSWQRRIQFILTMGSGLILVSLPLFPIPTSSRFLLWLALTAATLSSAFNLIIAWYGGEGRQTPTLWEKLRIKTGKMASAHDLLIIDEMTGVMALPYWLQQLQALLDKPLGAPKPITCLIVEIEGIGKLDDRRGRAIAQYLMAMVGKSIINDVREDDIVCRVDDSHFAVALSYCPARFAQVVGNRIAKNANSSIFKSSRRRYGNELNLVWKSATIPGHSHTAIELLEEAVGPAETGIKANTNVDAESLEPGVLLQ
jgi:diguanylate cyclase (GGDEF)-like protein